MTIVTSIKVRDGLVLGSDSMTQLIGPAGILKSYAHARKLFRLKDLPIGVMTHGLGSIGSASIEGVVRDFCEPATATAVEDLATDLYDYVRPLYDAVFPTPNPQTQGLGFVIGGYSVGVAAASEFEFILPTDTAPRPINAGSDVGAIWRGIGVPVTSIVKGVSPAIHEELMSKHGLTAADLDDMASRLGMQVILAGMPVQEAVEFATYILDTTIGWAKFQVGVPSCGRPLQMAVIRPNTGWEWLAEPRLRLPNG